MELPEFILTTTYFSFRGQMYQKKFSTAMGSPVSPIVTNLFLEELEQVAIDSAPDACRSSMWKHYMDDMLVIMKKGETENLMNHINMWTRPTALSSLMRKKKVPSHSWMPNCRDVRMVGLQLRSTVKRQQGWHSFCRAVITSESMPACKSLFSGVVCCSPDIMCAVGWCGITLITAGRGSRGCVQHSNSIGMPGDKFMARCV